MLPCWAGAQDGNRAARAEAILVAPIEVAVARKGERAGGNKFRGCCRELGSSARSG